MYKKSILFLSLIFVSFSANAEVKVLNYTNEDSSVYITSVDSELQRCARMIIKKQSPDGTPGESWINDETIEMLCTTSKNNVCTADLYNGSQCSANGTKVAILGLSLVRMELFAVKSYDSRYEFNPKDGGTLLEIRYA